MGYLGLFLRGHFIGGYLGVGIIGGGFKQVGQISLKTPTTEFGRVGTISSLYAPPWWFTLRPRQVSIVIDTIPWRRNADLARPSPELLNFLRRPALGDLQRVRVLERPEDLIYLDPVFGPSALGRGALNTGQGQHGRPWGHGREYGFGPQVKAVRQGPVDRLALVLGSLAEMEFHARAFEQEVVGERQLMAKVGGGTVGGEIAFLSPTIPLIILGTIRSDFPRFLQYVGGFKPFDPVNPRTCL